jgi:hypothetical protein
VLVLEMPWFSVGEEEAIDRIRCLCAHEVVFIKGRTLVAPREFGRDTCCIV